PCSAIDGAYALFLSRINWKKGLDRLIMAWKHVPELKLVIVGNDEENYLPSLISLAKREGVYERLRLVGPVSDEHKWALYANAQMSVPPPHSETLAIVAAEAMAMACPVIVTPGVGLASLVQAAEAGLVVDGDPASIARAVNELRCNDI